jgi:hypothetical protein
MIGMNRTQSWICFLICRSQASPPRSSLLSNQTSIPAARSASQILWAAPASLRGVAKEYSARRLTYRQNDPLILLTARALGTPESATWLCPVNVTPCSNAAVKSLLTV